MKQRKSKALGALLLFLILLTPYMYISVNAASRFALDNGGYIPSIIYANHSYNLRTSSSYVYYESSNNSIISVGKKNGKLVVKEPGKATIIARSRYTRGVICQQTFTVKRRSDYILSTTKKLTLVTGDAKKLSIKKSPSNSTDILRFRSNNTNVATVNAVTGLVKAVGAGTTNIVVYSKSSSMVENSDSSNRTLKIKVKVYSAANSAKQVQLNQIELSFSSTPSKLKNTDFTVESSSGRKVHVSSVSTDYKKATLTLAQNINDGKDYTVSYKSSSCDFTASDGIISKFDIPATKVPINTETAVTAYAYDKNGIQLGEYTYGTTYSDITFTVSSGYLTTNKKLNFTSKYGTATARIMYRKSVNGLYTTLADSGNVSITSFDPDLVSAQYRCHITSDTSYTFTKTSNCNLTLPAESYNFKAYFNILISSDREIGDYGEYRIESGNNDILFVTDSYLSNSKKSVDLYPVKTGSTYLYIKDSKNTVVYSFPVYVNQPAKLSSIAASKANLELNNIQSGMTETVTLMLKDQYGNTMDSLLSSNCYIECLGTTAPYTSTNDVYYNSGKYYDLTFPNLTFKTDQVQPGRYTYRVTCDNKYSYIYVNVSGQLITTS